MKLTSNGKMLALTAILSIVLAFLLTPLGGFETRPIAQVTVTGYATLAMFFAGVVLNLASIVALLSRPRAAGMLAMIGSILFFPVILADQSGLFSSLSPPNTISYLEVVLALELIVVIFYASRVREESKETKEAVG